MCIGDIRVRPYLAYRKIPRGYGGSVECIVNPPSGSFEVDQRCISGIYEYALTWRIVDPPRVRWIRRVYRESTELTMGSVAPSPLLDSESESPIVSCILRRIIVD